MKIKVSGFKIGAHSYSFTVEDDDSLMTIGELLAGIKRDAGRLAASYGEQPLAEQLRAYFLRVHFACPETGGLVSNEKKLSAYLKPFEDGSEEEDYDFDATLIPVASDIVSVGVKVLLPAFEETVVLESFLADTLKTVKTKLRQRLLSEMGVHTIEFKCLAPLGPISESMTLLEISAYLDDLSIFQLELTTDPRLRPYDAPLKITVGHAYYDIESPQEVELYHQGLNEQLWELHFFRDGSYLHVIAHCERRVGELLVFLMIVTEMPGPAVSFGEASLLAHREKTLRQIGLHDNCELQLKGEVRYFPFVEDEISSGLTGKQRYWHFMDKTPAAEVAREEGCAAGAGEPLVKPVRTDNAQEHPVTFLLPTGTVLSFLLSDNMMLSQLHDYLVINSAGFFAEEDFLQCVRIKNRDTQLSAVSSDTLPPADHGLAAASIKRTTFFGNHSSHEPIAVIAQRDILSAKGEKKKIFLEISDEERLVFTTGGFNKVSEFLSQVITVMMHNGYGHLSFADIQLRGKTREADIVKIGGERLIGSLECLEMPVEFSVYMGGMSYPMKIVPPDYREDNSFLRSFAK